MTFSKCKLSALTASMPCFPTLPVSNSFNMDSGSEAMIVLRRKGVVSLTMKRNTESVEIEKRLKKEIAVDFLRVGKEMLFADSKVS